MSIDAAEGAAEGTPSSRVPFELELRMGGNGAAAPTIVYMQATITGGLGMENPAAETGRTTKRMKKKIAAP